MNDRAGVLWTGGKDCALAFLEGQGLGYEICNLVTFIPKRRGDPTHTNQFRAHPLEHMKRQSELMGIRHLEVDIYSPFKEGYEKAIGCLKKDYGLGTLVTGDIDEIRTHGSGNWIRECSRYSGMRVETPLWKRDREELLYRVMDVGLEVFISCVKEPWFKDGSWIGGLDIEGIEELKRFHKEGNKGGNKGGNKEGNKEGNFDLCGEQGEYHTLVLDGPMFLKGGIRFLEYSVIKEEGEGIYYVEVRKDEVFQKGMGGGNG